MRKKIVARNAFTKYDQLIVFLLARATTTTTTTASCGLVVVRAG